MIKLDEAGIPMLVSALPAIFKQDDPAHQCCHDYANCANPCVLRAPAPVSRAEPIYQMQRADGSWIDQAEQSYRYNLSHGHPVRIVYASQSAPLTNEGGSEPTLIQYRMRPTWEPDGRGWTRWGDCTAESAQDYERVPVLHDWQYEVRRLCARSRW